MNSYLIGRNASAGTTVQPMTGLDITVFDVSDDRFLIEMPQAVRKATLSLVAANIAALVSELQLN